MAHRIEAPSDVPPPNSLAIVTVSFERSAARTAKQDLAAESLKAHVPRAQKEATQVITSRNDAAALLTVLSAVYIAAILVSNATAGRLVQIGPAVFPGAIFLFSLTFTLRDAIHVVGGWKVAKALIWAGFIANVLLAGYGLLVNRLPAPIWFDDAAYTTVFGTTARVVVASLLAFVVATYLNAWVFESLKNNFLARILTSNVVSTTIDTMIFISIAFAGTGAPIVNLILVQIAVKMVFSTVLIPLVFWVRGNLRSRGLALEGY